MNIEYNINETNLTINQILNENLKISTRLKNKLIKNKGILLNDEPTDTRITPKVNDILKIILDYPEDSTNIISFEMDLDILYEDSHLLIVNKPAGIAVHPSILHYNDTLSNGIKFYYEKQGLNKKIRPVNRLDLNTSGIVVFAKNEYIQECLIKQMQDDTFKKEYVALVHGNFIENNGMINAPIARKENSIIERCISPLGQEAITLYEVIKKDATIQDFMNYRKESLYRFFEEKDSADKLFEINFSEDKFYENKSFCNSLSKSSSSDNEFCLVKCILKTGRTHQIRVHMAHIGHPLVGDSLYGNTSKFLDGQALHCYKIRFIHPVTHNLLTLCTDL